MNAEIVTGIIAGAGAALRGIGGVIGGAIGRLIGGGGAATGTTTAAVKNPVAEWLGAGARVITNRAGDKVFLSKDGLRRVRFDFNNPAPHLNPHSHAEQLINGKWMKSGQIYPVGVPRR